MATLFDVTLDLARHVRGVTRHKVTDVSGKRISSNRMNNGMGEYLNGTVWFMTGESAGHFSKIKTAKDDFIIPEDDTLNVAAGDTLMMCPWIDFDLDDLIEAINSVLYRYPIFVWDNTLTWDAQNLVYDLPDGVSDIRQVKIASSSGSGTFVTSHKWLEENRQLRFSSAGSLYGDGGEIQIGYRKMHGEVYEATDEIDPAVDLNYLRNMAFLYLWRNLIIVQHKDNPIAADMYNEAKVYESEYTKFNQPERNIPLRSFYTRW